MKQISVILAVAFFISPVLPAQDHGEMLYFEKKPHLDIQLDRSPEKNAPGSVLYESPVSDRSRQPYSRILFNGTSADSHIVIQVSYRETGGSWSNWEDIYLKIFENGRFWARYDLPSGVSRQIKYRIVNRGINKPAARFQIFAIEGVPGKAGNFYEQEKAGDRPDDLQIFQVDSVPKPDIISRDEWGALDPVGQYVPHDPYRMTQHHTAGTRVFTLQDGIAEMQFIQDFHQNGRGWNDIGYHFCIDDSGRIYEGVPADYRGTHVGGNNTGNIGISYMGNFQISSEFPTAKALENLVKIWSWLAFHYGINPDSLMGHRDFNATSCPGDNLYIELPNLRNGVRRTLGFGAPFVKNPFPQPFSTEVLAETEISFSIRDDEEGVDFNSIVVKVNNQPVVPDITGTAAEYQISYQTAEPFPPSQNVIVEVDAADLANPANQMNYSYTFKTEVAAVYSEVESPTSMRNARLELTGDWNSDDQDVELTGLTSGQRLTAVDTDGSHMAKIYPEVPESGDYKVFLAANSIFLGGNARFRFVNENQAVHPHFIEYNDVYYRDWSRLSPSPVYFGQGAGSEAYIELSGLPDIETWLVLDAFRLEKVDRLDSPTAPTLKWARVTDYSGNEIEIAWYPSLEGDIAGYRLYMSEDILTWDQPLVDENTLTAGDFSHRLNYQGNSNTVYFRVVAVDTNSFEDEGGNEVPLRSAPSDAYGVGLASPDKILIVDNFDRRASWLKSYHPFVGNYGEAISYHQVGFESCTETAVQNGEINLNDYQVVIYFCGDDSRADESLAAADQQRLLNYMKNGGKLFISGSEIGYDFEASPPDEQSRYQNLLKARYAGDLSGSNRVLGEVGTVFEGLDIIYGTAYGPNLYIEDYPDYLLPHNGSGSALFYDNLRIAGIQYTGSYENSDLNAQLVYLGFTFETIVMPEDRADLMGRVLGYFGMVSSLAENNQTNPQTFELLQNYPNPFNPKTSIRYSVPRTSRVRLEIFNALGQRVKTVLEKKQGPGRYSVEWDGRNDLGQQVASGVYYYQLNAGDFQKIRKMILLK